MPSKRLTITLFGGQHLELERLVSVLNEGRAEPVTMAQVIRVALARLLEDNAKNHLELSKQFELPFSQG